MAIFSLCLIIWPYIYYWDMMNLNQLLFLFLLSVSDLLRENLIFAIIMTSAFVAVAFLAVHSPF